MLETWLIVVYLLVAITFQLLMFVVISPKTVMKRLENWMQGGKFDETLKGFMDRYGGAILGLAIDQIVNRVQMSIRGNQGVVSRGIKKAQKELSEQIFSETSPIVSQIAKQIGYQPDNPMMAQLIGNLTQGLEQKAQEGLLNAVNGIQKSTENINIPENNPK